MNIGADPYTVTLTACVAGDAAYTNIQYYWWNLGAGQPAPSGATLRTVTNTYGPGSYDVTLTVSNSLGMVTNSTRAACVRVVGANATAYVATNGGNVYPYDTWAKAATNIPAAVDVVGLAIDLGAPSGLVLASNGVHSLDRTIGLVKPITVRGPYGAAQTTVQKAAGAWNMQGFYLTHSNAALDGLTISGFGTVGLRVGVAQ